MEKLWAPWRLDYILDEAISSDKKKPCVFCQREKPRPGGVASDREDLILRRGKTCYTILNKFPYNNGHLMIIPFTHEGDFTSLPAATAGEMMQGAQTAVGVLRTVFKADGFNVGMNLGKNAGAGIPDHVHIHVVPRWQGDTNFMPVIGDVRVLPEYVEKTYDRLIEEFNK